MSDSRDLGCGMTLRNWTVSTLAVVIGVLGLGLASAGPAAATQAGNWRAFGNTNPITSTSDTTWWSCGHTISVATDVLAQVCVVKNIRGTARQGAVIVRNNRPGLYGAEAAVDLSTIDEGFYDRWICPRSGVGANSWSVCFGSTVLTENGMWAHGGVNGVDLPVSPYA